MTTTPTTPPRALAVDAVAGYRRAARSFHDDGALGWVRDLAAEIDAPRPRAAYSIGAQTLTDAADALAESLIGDFQALPARATRDQLAAACAAWSRGRASWEIARVVTGARESAFPQIACELGAGSVDLADLVEGWDDPRDILALDLVEVARVAVLHKLAPLPGVITRAALAAIDETADETPGNSPG